MSAQSPVAPSRQETLASNFSDEAVPEADPSHAAGLLSQRLQAWKHAVVYLEEYMEAVEKIHKAHAKEYERVLKTISKPLREGDHFDQSLGGVAGFFENMRVNTQALINTNLETEKHIKGSVLPIIERLHKEIKHKAKELSHGAEKGAKEVEKARNSTQKHIELLGQHTASYESTGHKAHPADDPYVIRRGILHRLSKQVVEENNHRNDLIAVQANFQTFEAHVVHVMQESMEAFNSFAGGQAEKTRALYNDMLGAVQRIPPDFEWNKFVARKSDVLINPNDPPRALEGIQFPNMDHSSTKPLIEGTLERKSRNKLAWGTQTGYYVVTPCKFLHEFKDNDNLRKDPTPELSIYLPDAIIGAPHGEKFNVKGKDRSKTMSSKLTGHSELAFKAHTPADAEKWFNVIRNVAGATGPAEPSPEPSPVDEKANPAAATAGTEKLAINTSDGHESGVTGGPAVLSPVSATTAAPANEKHAPTALDTKGGAAAAAAVPTPPASAKAEKAPVALA